MKYLKYFESNDIDIISIAKDVLIDLDDIDNLDYLLTPKNRYKPGAIALNFIYLSDQTLYSKELNDVENRITPIIDRFMSIMNEYGLLMGYWRDVEEFSDGGYVSSHPSEWQHLKTPMYQGRLTKPLKYYVKKSQYYNRKIS